MKLLSGFDKDFYLYMNRIRSNPKSVIEKVKGQMANIKGMIMTSPNGPPIMLWEGKSAW